MGNTEKDKQARTLPFLYELPTPVRTLLTVLILTLALAMLGAVAQIVVHDVIPTFSGNTSTESAVNPAQDSEPFYESYRFITLLKWTHIHLFGMAFIFILLGCVTVLLAYPSRLRVLLVIVPFLGILIDISAVWLKDLVSPAFFWMHVPGGGAMFGVFGFVSLKALGEMWFRKV